LRVGGRACPISLVGEEIESPWNAAALADIAALFGGSYRAYGESSGSPVLPPAMPRIISDASALDAQVLTTKTNINSPPIEAIHSFFDYVIAAENAPGAQSIYSFRPPPTGAAAILVGNEARGLRPRTLKQADAIVEIPLRSRNINCLNVAAAAAVMLYYLSLDQRLEAKQTTATAMTRRRPDLLLVGGADPMELGSTIRSACAFGWEHVFLDDPQNAWYECDRRIKSDGRGAARRGRNPIKVIPHCADRLAHYRKMVVFTTKSKGRPAWKVPVSSGDVLAVLPDESQSSEAWSPPAEWNGELIYAALPESAPAQYHYRQMTAIALAEIARQVGKSTGRGVYLLSKRDRHRREIPAAASITSLTLQDLQIF